MGSIYTHRVYPPVYPLCYPLSQWVVPEWRLRDPPAALPGQEYAALELRGVGPRRSLHSASSSRLAWARRGVISGSTHFGQKSCHRIERSRTRAGRDRRYAVAALVAHRPDSMQPLCVVALRGPALP